jgi:hypothetical protein
LVSGRCEKARRRRYRAVAYLDEVSPNVQLDLKPARRRSGTGCVRTNKGMHISDAQREIRTHFIGGSYGQFVSGALWLASAALATWKTPGMAMLFLVVAGMFIFPLTQLLIRIENRGTLIRPENSLNTLGMLVAFVLPLSMPLLLPVVRYRQDWFYPAMMILVGAHYLPFVFLYGMRMFLLLAAALLAAGFFIALSATAGFATGGWIGGIVLSFFGLVGRILATREAADGGEGGTERF